MTDKQNNIVKGVLSISVLFLYFLGVRQWKMALISEVPEKVAYGKHLYFICFSSALYMATFVSVVSIVFAKHYVLNFILKIVNTVCAVILYQEVRYGNAQWSVWSYWIIVVGGANFILQSIILDKLKVK